MTVADLNQILADEGTDPATVELVIGFTGGAFYKLESADLGRMDDGFQNKNFVLVPAFDLGPVAE